MPSPLDGSRRTAQVTVPSSTGSCTPVTVTVCAVLQAEGAKVRVVEAAGTPPPADTSPSPSSRLVTVTVTASEGRVRSATVKVAVPPASVA